MAVPFHWATCCMDKRLDIVLALHSFQDFEFRGQHQQCQYHKDTGKKAEGTILFFYSRVSNWIEIITGFGKIRLITQLLLSMRPVEQSNKQSCHTHTMLSCSFICRRAMFELSFTFFSSHHPALYIDLGSESCVSKYSVFI